MKNGMMKAVKNMALGAVVGAAAITAGAVYMAENNTIGRKTAEVKKTGKKMVQAGQDLMENIKKYNNAIKYINMQTSILFKPDGYFGDYRVKLNVEASPETMLDYGSKIPLVSCQKSEQNYYHWNVREYDIKDVRSIVDWRNKKVIYESDDEILSNFIDGYLSKLG